MEVVLPEIIYGVLALISPLLTAFFLKRNMSAQAKSWIAVVISAVIALVYVFLEGGFNNLAGPEEYAAALGIAYGIGQLVYNTLLKAPAKTVEAKYGITSGSVSGSPEGSSGVAESGKEPDPTLYRGDVRG